jgi:hypothetical protein
MILFLDFDGVLHPEIALSTRRDFEHLPRLWKILRAVPEVQVVFATSWRTSRSLDELIALMTRDGGEDLAHRFVGSNPVVKKESREQGDYGHRRDECLAWIEANRTRFPFWIKDIPWVAIDDIPHFYGIPCFNLYMTDCRTGLTEADVALIIRKLEGTLRPQHRKRWLS